MSGVFCDHLNISFPKDCFDDVLSSVAPVFDLAGASMETDSLYRFAAGGTCKIDRRYGVSVLRMSGQALYHLRALDLFASYLQSVAEHSYRVTLLHATLDLPDRAPPVLDRLYKHARRGGVRLSQRCVKPENVRRIISPDIEGVDTGTVYLNGRKADVYAKVYDKRHERLCAAGIDIGPCTRVEIGVTSRQGITLKDAWDPTAVFYHYASPQLVQAPPGQPEWVPGDVGFKLPPKVTSLPAQRLMRLIESSADVRRIVELAEQVGPHGRDLVYRYLDRQMQQAASPPLGASTGLNVAS